MKFLTLMLAAAGFVVLTGCETPPSLISLDPVVTDQDTAVDGALTGAWEVPGDDDQVCIIKRDDHNGYKIALLGNGEPIKFQARIFRVGPAEFLDVVPADDNDFRVPGHALARIWTGASTLKWAFLDTDWLKQAAAQLTPHTADGKTLLLAPGAAVRSFLTTSGVDDKAHGDVTTWQKMQ
jgi:hypothetical protein